MDWEPQGLVKYECYDCEKEFIVGLIDYEEQKPICCPFCNSINIDDVVLAEPNKDYSPQWLYEMGCMGINIYKEGDSD